MAADLETRMLSGEPFTYGGLCATYGKELNEDRTRVIDKTIQRLRRKGLIAFTREGRSTVWRPTQQVQP
ncbi:hypothetical protein [Brevundimonas diminuta]|uniref:Uncharacterized protein n=1 Tax=Brevundimonas diminuta TaxID=293 RepID=A0A410NVE6_BREDI|nr:hypothetical protein [Brevundimonas diminuta]QAT13847.1 hypothetical protein EQG53_05450 [Brevundimonas diminuta]QQB88788.1 hypothetical protein I6H83_16980 [Brevundimonas diminuta]